MPAPRWLTEVEDALACRAAGVILTMNTGDRVLLAQEDLQIASLKYALAYHFAQRGYHVGAYASGLGFQELVPPSMTPQPSGSSPFGNIPISASDPAVALTVLGRVLRQQDARAMVIVDYADHVAPHTSGMTAMLSPSQMQALQVLHAWGADDDIQATQNFVILIAHENSVSSLLTQGGGYRTVTLDLPDERARIDFAEYLLATRAAGYEDVLGALESQLSTAEFGRVTGGLRLLDIEQLFRQAGGRSKPITREAVRLVKQRAISQICRDLVEVMEPERGFEAVAGAEHAKEFFELLRRPWLSGIASIPQAILLAGVPGCGKSHLVQALARELQCPLLVMRNVREAWVGASERNLETVLWVAENLSPCILWTDEVDQAIGQRGTGASGDSGTSERMLARTFEFFGSGAHRGKILWVATTNRPDLLDPALLDRFQVIIPFIHPTRAERAALLHMLVGQIGRMLGADVRPDDVAAMPELGVLTVRSLQEILVMAGLRADFRAGAVGSPISNADIEPAVRDYKPTYDPVEHEFLALKALEMTSFNSLLPWMGGHGLRRGAEWPRYLDSLIDRESGRLKPSGLYARIRELQQLRISERVQR
jgi:AAA+ superfamily predicted ATPase